MTNELVLQQQGLFELPPAINELTELEILKLSANHLNSAPPHFEETLQSLQVLWLKNCEVQELDNRSIVHNHHPIYPPPTHTHTYTPPHTPQHHHHYSLVITTHAGSTLINS